MANDGTLKFDTSIDGSGFSDGLSKLGSIAKTGVAATTAVLAGVTTAITAAGAASIKLGAEFETTMAKASTLFGDVAVDTDNLEKKMLAISSSTGVAAAEMGEALYSALSAGIPVSEDMAEATMVLEKSAQLAKAGFTDVDTALSATAKTMNAYGLGVEAVDDIQKVLIQTQNLGITTVDELGASLAQVTPTAAAFGVSFDQVGAALAGMTAAGTPTAQATTQLNSLIAELGKNGTIAANNLTAAAEGTEYAGMSFNEMMDSGANLQDVLGMLSASAEESGVSLVDMFSSIEAGKAALSIDGSDFLGNLEAMGTEADVVGDAYEKMSRTMESNVNQIKTTMQNLGISMYQSVDGPLADITQSAEDMVNQLYSAFSEGGFDGLVSSVGDILSQIVTGIADAAPTMINSAVELVSSFCDGLRSAPGMGDAVSGLVASLVSGIASCTDEMWSTAIVLIGKLSDGLAAAAPDAVGAIGTAMTNIMECLVDWSPDIVQAGIDIILALVQGIADTLPTLMTQIVWLTEMVLSTLIDNLPALVQAGIDILMALVQGFTESIPQIITAITSLIPQLCAALTEAIPILLEGAIALFTAILDALPIIIEQLLQALPGIITTVITFFTDNIPVIIEGAITLLMGIIEAIPTIIQAIVDNLPQIITALVGGLVGALPQLLDGAVQLLMGIIQAFPQIIVAIVENLPTIIGALVEGLLAALPQIITAAVDLLGGIIKAIPDIVVGIGEAMPQIITGIVNGLLNGVGSIIDAAKNLGSSIIGGFKDILGIHSPSKVMEEQGDYLTDGLLNGIADLPDKVSDAISGTKDIINAWGDELTATGLEVLTLFVEQVVTPLLELPGKMLVLLTDVLNTVAQWGINLRNKATEAVQTMINGMVALMATLPDKFVQIGANIVQGIWQGISSGWDWLRGKVAELADSLLDAAKDALGINSPSTEFRDKVGRWLIPGITEGMDRTVPQADAEIRKVAGHLTSTMQAEVQREKAKGTTATAARATYNAKTETDNSQTIDQSFTQYNEYNCPTATPSEINKSQREAARKLLGGVK